MDQDAEGNEKLEKFTELPLDLDLEIGYEYHRATSKADR